MRDRELIVHAKLTLTAHRDAVVTLPAALAAAEFEALPLAAASYDKPLVAGGEGSDPTQAAAFNALTRKPDKAARLRKEIEHSLGMIATHVDIVIAATKEILEEHDPKVAKKRQQRLEDIAVAGGECCKSCYRTYVAPGTRRQVPTRGERAVKDGTDGGYRFITEGHGIGDKWRLCRWCLQFADRTGRLPSTEEVEAHHTPGKKVRVPPSATG